MIKLIISWMIGIISIFGMASPVVFGAVGRRASFLLNQPQQLNLPDLFPIIIILVIYFLLRDKKKGDAYGKKKR